MGLGTRLRRCRGGLPRTVWWRADRPPPHRSARSKRRHNRHSEQRKLVELTPYINICDLIRWKAIPHQWDKSYFLEAPFRYGFVKHLVISCETIEIHHHSGYIQPVLLRWIRTGFGCPRPSLTCRCGRSIHRLFFRHGSLACKDCHKLAYASQQQDAITRKRLAASKLRLQLGGLPDIREPLPAKPKWIRRKTYQCARNQVQALEAKATRRFRKPIPTQTFAYHVG